MVSIKSLLVGVAAVFGASSSSLVLGAPHNGWNENIDWKTLEEAPAAAQAAGKPIMTLIHKSWCGACKQLKDKFRSSAEIEDLAKNFIMVNAMDDDEPKGEEWKPDGGYIPRIIFSDSTGKIRPEVKEAPNPKYQYFYSDAQAVIKVMHSAMAQLGNGGGGATEL